jgi:6-phosphogluconolactonase/glucosamine-6-phosphate isomerase/deaminase
VVAKHRIMLRDLAQEEVPWKDVHVVRVDERVAPETHFRELGCVLI